MTSVNTTTRNSKGETVMSKLYELTEEFSNLEAWFDDDDVDKETLLDTLEGVEGEYNDKIEGYCKVIKNFEAEAKALKEEADRLAKRSRTLNNKVDYMKFTMLESMRATGKKEAGNLLKAKIAKNGGKLPLVFTEGVEVPVTFKKIEYKVDNEAIRKALDEGEELDFAKYGERGESLRIK